MMRIADIIKIVSLATGTDVLDIISDRRGPICRPRHIAMYLAKQCTDHTLTEIGNAFNRRDHSSVIHALERVTRDMETDDTLRALVASLNQAIQYRETLEAVGKVDVLAVARTIALQPRRGAIESSTYELAALAVFTLDLWEIASCAEAMAHALGSIDLPSDAVRLRSLAAAILDEMNHVAGPAPAEPERTDT